MGAVYWPYAYSDIFDYTFWPYAYDGAFWAYAYDDLFEVVFWPGGDPYSGYAYSGPHGGTYAIASGGRATARSREATQVADALCRDPGAGVTAWPFAAMEKAIRPDDGQRALLADLKDAAARASEAFKTSCPSDVPMTPPGRLQAMIMRLQATRDAVQIVSGPLDKFYDALSDEQKARFNAVGPEIGRNEARAARNRPREQQADACGESKPGLTNLPIERIEDAVRPSGDQQAALDRLNDATKKAVDTLQAACPESIALTPVGRLETMQKRLDAMLTAAKIIQPALEDFYAALNNEQKAEFNVLGRETTGANR